MFKRSKKQKQDVEVRISQIKEDIKAWEYQLNEVEVERMRLEYKISNAYLELRKLSENMTTLTTDKRK